MKYEVIPNSCRICLRQNRKLRSIYKPLEEGDEPPVKMLQHITGISFENAKQNAQTLPKSICKSCELSLNLAFQFRTKALKSQRIIDKYCSNLYDKDGQTSSSDIKQDYEVKSEPDDFMDSNDSMEDEVQLSANDKEKQLESYSNSEIKIEMVQMELLGKSDDDYDDDDIFIPVNYDDEIVEYLDESYLDSEDEDESFKHVADDDDSQIDHLENIQSKNKNISAEKEMLNKSKSPAQSRNNNTKQKRLKLNGKPSRKRKLDKSRSDDGDDDDILNKNAKIPNKSTDKSRYICDICGNIYPQRGRMMEHRRRHDKELRYACEICDKRFHLREKLRKHIFQHKGVKPYKCSSCSRTFFYESVRKAHEAVHSGHKPYVCGECNKAFAYPHALKKHKLIHADIKLYHCEYCDKDFRLQHHMKQHVETKMHQNAVHSKDAPKTMTMTMDDES